MSSKTLKFKTTQENGCRTKQAVDWEGPEPAKVCEVFVKNIPRDLTEDDIWPLFARYGKVFQLRLLMDYNGLNRGFCFVVFSKETEANSCVEIMNHFYLTPGHLLHIEKSIDKSRLFASNLPRHVPKNLIREKFMEIFPEMISFIIPDPIIGGENESSADTNRGFAFLNFASHCEAVKAKKRIYTGVFKVWGQQIHINWAKPEYNFGDERGDTEGRQIVVKNLDSNLKRRDFLRFLYQFIEFHKIESCCLKYRLGVVKLKTLSDADFLFAQLQGKTLNGMQLIVEWHQHCSNNYNRILELKSLANSWTKPILIIGRYFSNENQQYAVYFTKFGAHISAIFFKIRIYDNLNIPNKVAEVFVSLIEEAGYLPNYNYFLDIGHDQNQVIGYIKNLEKPVLMRTNQTKHIDFQLYWTEIIELSSGVHTLSTIDPDFLYHKILSSKSRPVKLPNGNELCILEGITTINRAFICPSTDKEDTNMLMLCDKYTGSNCFYYNDNPVQSNIYNSPMCLGKHPQTITLKNK